MLLATALALSGCGSLSDGTPLPEGLLLELNGARGEEHVNGPLVVKVRTEGGMPDQVELLLEGTLLATLSPPFEYTWDTTVMEEGVYELQARALWRDAAYTSEPHVVTVDRTGPRIMWALPVSDNVSVADASTVHLGFTERVRIAEGESLAVGYSVGASGSVARLRLSEDGWSLTGSMERVPPPPYDGRAWFRLDGVTDWAGNPVQSESSEGPEHVWSWRAPVFKRISNASVRGGGRPAMALDAEGASIVAVADLRAGEPLLPNFQEGHHIVVGRVHEGVWRALGGPFTAPGDSQQSRVSHPLLVLDAEGQPVVAFLHRATANARAVLHVFRWTASRWRPLGLALNAPEDAELHGAALALDGEGRPVVAWSAADGIRVRRWESEQWQPVGDVQRASTAPGATVAADAPALSVNRAGHLFLAWAEAAAEDVGAGLYVRAWAGSGWEPVGGRLAYGPHDVLRQQVSEPALATTPDGLPVAVWAEMNPYGTHEDVVVARWSGADWALSPVPSIDLSYDMKSRRWPAVAVDGDGRALVTFVGGRPELGLYASWYSSSGQHSVDLISDRGRASSLSLDSEGRPVVAWFWSNALRVVRPNE